jgi:hypothetical protein
VKLTPDAIAEALTAEPLVGTTKASEILGIKPPNFRRDAAPHLTTVTIEGSAAAYFRSQVEALAQDRARRSDT